MSICSDHIFKRVFERLQPIVQRFIRSKGLDMEQSADLAQDAFVRLWGHCGKVTEEKAKSFLLTVANNLVIDNARKSKTKKRYDAELIQVVEREDPEHMLRMKDFKNELDVAIAGMTEGSREVFLMSRFNDMSYKDIAQALDLSVKAVEKRMSLALRHLTEQGILRKK